MMRTNVLASSSVQRDRLYAGRLLEREGAV